MRKQRREITDSEICACYERIRNRVAALCGVQESIETGDGIAFSGSREAPELVLTVSSVKIDGRYCLYADLDDEVSWQEWDFSDRTEFENDIAETIAALVNRTVKTVTEQKRRKYLRRRRYYLNEQNEWVLMEEETLTMWWLRLFLRKDSVEEDVKVYRMK